MNSVGNRILDGSKIIPLLEISQRRQIEYQGKADTAQALASAAVEEAQRQLHQCDAMHYQEMARLEYATCEICNKRIDEYDCIESNTAGLFSFGKAGREIAIAAMRNVLESFTGKSFKCDTNAPWKTDLRNEYKKLRSLSELDEYGVKRPESMTEAQWQEYQLKIIEQIDILEEQGWAKASKEAYIKYINKHVAECAGGSAIEKLKDCNAQTQKVGSKIFQEMWYAWDATEDTEARKKLSTVMKVTEMAELNGTAEQTQALLSHMDPNLAPHDLFWDDFSNTVQMAYPNGLEGDGISGSASETLARNVYQFRYVIDAQQVQYIRREYDGETDKDKLAAYIRDLEKHRGNTRDGFPIMPSNFEWTTGESDRLHQKYMLKNGQKIYPDGSNGPNYKITVNHGFYSEFILNEKGDFLYILDNSGDLNSVINGASFNYADNNDIWKDKIVDGWSKHDNLDVDSVGKYDPQFRKEANPVVSDKNGKTTGENKYKCPSNTKAYETSGLKELSDQKKAEFKENVYGQ